jgi:hypothetical protein
MNSSSPASSLPIDGPAGIHPRPRSASAGDRATPLTGRPIAHLQEMSGNIPSRDHGLFPESQSRVQGPYPEQTQPPFSRISSQLADLAAVEYRGQGKYCFGDETWQMFVLGSIEP